MGKTSTKGETPNERMDPCLQKSLMVSMNKQNVKGKVTTYRPTF